MAELAQANGELGGMRAGEAEYPGGGDDLSFSASGDPWAKK